MVFILSEQKSNLFSFLREHWLALSVAFAVGFLYIAPHLFFIRSLGDGYKGIPMMQTANEDEYLMRIQEIADGHWSLGSPVFFEYKNEPPLSPPVGEFFYALPTLVFGISPVSTLIASRFVLPFILFLLVYMLIYRLISPTPPLNPQKYSSAEESFGPASRRRAPTLRELQSFAPSPSKEGGRRETVVFTPYLDAWRQGAGWTAIAGALFVTLGYDLIDYRTVLSYLSGASSPGSFLLWSRPVNPILGELFLFSFLLLVLAILEHTKRRKSAVAGAGIFLALMFGSYFFSWGIALSVLAALVLLSFFRKEYKISGMLALVIPLGVLFASPYWIGIWRASQSPWYEESVLRSGLFLTHYPLLNKLLLVTLFVFIAFLLLDYFLRRRTIPKNITPQSQHTNKPENVGVLRERHGCLPRVEYWHLFCFALLLGGLLAYSQQIITGRTIWPYHFVQYTIPLSVVVGMVVLHRIIREYSRYAWIAPVFVVALSSLVFGVYTQASTYTRSSPFYAELQSSSFLFDWLNTRERDCVVLSVGDGPEGFDSIIPAFTHCNLYDSTSVFSLLPEERIQHNYFITLSLNGVTAENIDRYALEHKSEARGRLYANWKELFGVKDFPDFSYQILEERLKEFPGQYKEFMQKDFETELKKYHLDYILINGEPSISAKKLIQQRKVLYADGDIAVYQF